MRAVRVRPEAAQELLVAYAWYLDFQPIEQSASGVLVRRMPLRSFPYIYIYVIDANDIVQVVAFTHVRRERYWWARIR